MFRRLSSCSPISTWVLRCPDVEPACVNILSNGDFSTTNDWVISGGYTPDATISGGSVGVGQQKNGNISQTVSLTPGNCYNVSIEILNASSATAYVTVGGVATAVVTTVGVHTFTVVAGSTPEVKVFFTTAKTVGALVFDNVVVCPCFVSDAEDIILDTELLKIKTIEIDGVLWDYIYYCGDDLGQTLDCGKFESIIQSDKTYYSEIITVKDFADATSPYLLIEWYNTCDLGGIYYSDCFYNKLWLDAVIAEPSYPIEESGQNNGENKFVATFQKWQKIRQIQTGEVPEFLVDALTLMKLHDTINITYPLREEATSVDAAVEIEQVNPRVTWLFLGCTANIAIDFIVDEVVVDSSCCRPMTIPACEEANYNVIDSVCEDDLPDANDTTVMYDEFEDEALWDGDGVGNKWQISVTTASFDNSLLNSNVIEFNALTIPIVAGARYIVEYDISAISGSFVQFNVGGTLGTTQSTVGTWTETIIAGSTGVVQLIANLGTANIEYMSIKRHFEIGDQYLVFTDCETFEGQIYTWNGSSWDLTDNVEGDIVQVGNETSGVWWYYNGDFWYQVPSISTVDYDSVTEILTVTGFVLPGACAEIQVSLLGPTHGFSTYGTATEAQLASGFQLTGNFPQCDEEDPKFWVRIRMKTWNCTYGVSDSIEVTVDCAS